MTEVPTPPGADAPQPAPTRRARREAMSGEPSGPMSLAEVPPRPLVPLGALAFAAAVAACSRAGSVATTAMALVVLVGGIVLAWGWTRLMGLPSRKGTLVVTLLIAAVLVASVALPSQGHLLGWLPLGLAVCVTIAFVHQMLRTDGRPRVVQSIGGTMLAIALLASGATWIAVPSLRLGVEAASAALAAVCAAALVEWVCVQAKLWAWLMPLVMVVGGIASVAVGLALGLAWQHTLLLGVAAAAVSFAVRAMFAPAPTMSARRAQFASAVASVLMSGVVVELVTSAFIARG